MKNNTTHKTKAYASLLLVSLAFITASNVNAAMITSQLDLGDQNANVTSLQTFLAGYPNIYPQGLVTGYYGSLTAAAVSRFQTQYGLDAVGRVGPQTMAKINSLMSGGGSSTGDVSGPWISQVNQSVQANTATFSWTTNENATGKVFYFTSPVMMNEGDINSIGFGSTNGWTSGMTAVGTSHQVTLNGLQPNTRYYYVVVSTDTTGNVSVWNPNSTFVTTQ